MLKLVSSRDQEKVMNLEEIDEVKADEFIQSKPFPSFFPNKL